MKIIKKLKIKLIFITIAIIIFYFIVATMFSSNFIARIIKDNTPYLVKEILNKTLFIIPYLYKNNNELKNNLEELRKDYLQLDIELNALKNKIDCCSLEEDKIITSDKGNKWRFKKFTLPFYDLKEVYKNKKQAYLEIFNDKILSIFWSGKIILIEKDSLNSNNLNFKEIKSNLYEDFLKDKNKILLKDQNLLWIGVKDIKVHKNKIFVSYTKKINQNCYNLSLLSAVMDINYIKFEEFLTYPECVDVYKSSVINNTKFFAGWQTGGRIDFIDDDNIIFSTGDFGDWSLPQNEESFFGKIIKFNISSKKISFISKGHRNPQGLYWDELKNLILSTEHGPMGGDEINKIKITEKKIINYGWPMASYGEHYRNTPLNYYIHKTAPLKKSHKDYGFEEPVKVYKIGIGISQIIKNNISNIKNDYLITSLQDKSLHNIIFDENLENILFEDKIVLNERVRDIIFDKYTKRYYLSLENTPAIGVLEKY
jgi:hypothetical protein